MKGLVIVVLVLGRAWLMEGHKTSFLKNGHHEKFLRNDVSVPNHFSHQGHYEGKTSSMLKEKCK
jgi:hypothetical protein